MINMQLITDTPLSSYTALDPIAQRTLKVAKANHTTLALDAYLVNLQKEPWYSYELDYVLSHDEKAMMIAYKDKDPLTILIKSQVKVLVSEQGLADYHWERSEALFETPDMNSLVHDVIVDIKHCGLDSSKGLTALGYSLFYLGKEDCYLAFQMV